MKNQNKTLSDIMLSGVNNIMLDLETMGKKSNSAIVSIGAVRFNEEICDRFYIAVSLQSCLDFGLEIDADTVMWWLRQEKEVIEHFSIDHVSLPYALNKFSEWIGKNAIVWGNGSTFDNVILSNAYDKAKNARPWAYDSDRCYRTIKNMRPDIKGEDIGKLHKADDDAEYQARHIIKIIKSFD